MDPNSSILAMFDPINKIPSTPSQRDDQDDKENAAPNPLSMSTFFSRINSKPTTKSALSSSRNRNSLFEFDSFTFTPGTEPIPEEQNSRDTTPTRDVLLDITGDYTPVRKHRNDTKRPTVSSPLRFSNTRDENDSKSIFLPATNNEARLPVIKAPRFKSPQRSPQCRGPRRSSLDVSALTLKLEDRLADLSLGFDLINDEMSFMSAMTEVDPNVKIPALPEKVPATADTTKSMPVSSFVLPPLAFDSEPRVTPSARPNTRSPPPQLALSGSLSSLFESDRLFAVAEDTEEKSVPLEEAHSKPRKPRRSVFDALDSTPSSQSQVPLANIVTTWDNDMPTVRKMAPRLPMIDATAPSTSRSRHMRALSSTSASSTGSTNYLPALTFEKSRPTLPSVTASPEQPTDAKSRNRHHREESAPSLTELRIIPKRMEADGVIKRRYLEDKESVRPVLSSASHGLRRTKTTIATTSSVLLETPANRNTLPLSRPTTRVPAEPATAMKMRRPSMSVTPRLAPLTRPVPSTNIQPRTLSRTTSTQTLLNHGSNAAISATPAPAIPSARGLTAMRSQSRIGAAPATVGRVPTSMRPLAVEKNAANEKERGMRDWAMGVAAASSEGKRAETQPPRTLSRGLASKPSLYNLAAASSSSRSIASRPSLAPSTTAISSTRPSGVASLTSAKSLSRPSMTGLARVSSRSQLAPRVRGA